MAAEKKCSHPKGSLSSPVFPHADPQILTLSCGKCGERVWFDLRDGPVEFGEDDSLGDEPTPEPDDA